MDTVTALKLLVLIFALPAQYYIAQNWSNDQHEQNQAIQSLFTSISSFKQNYLNAEQWKKWYVSFVVDRPKRLVLPKKNKNANNQQGDETLSFNYDIALDVLNFRKTSLYYGESSRTRSPRPSSVQFRVGQVVRNKRSPDSYGVIIGWDETLQANPAKLNDFIDSELTFDQPYYLVLIDHKGKANKQESKFYVGQNDIEIVHDVTIENHLIPSYFDKYANGIYWSGKYLKTVYPDDQ